VIDAGTDPATLADDDSLALADGESDDDAVFVIDAEAVTVTVAVKDSPVFTEVGAVKPLQDALSTKTTGGLPMDQAYFHDNPKCHLCLVLLNYLGYSCLCHCNH
jgi:hypothetical protein